MPPACLGSDGCAWHGSGRRSRDDVLRTYAMIRSIKTMTRVVVLAVIAMALVCVLMLVHDGEGDEEGGEDEDGGQRRRMRRRRRRLSMMRRRRDEEEEEEEG